MEQLRLFLEGKDVDVGLVSPETAGQGSTVKGISLLLAGVR